MFCKNCGKRIDDDARFCPSCGISFGNAGTAIATADAVKAPQAVKNNAEQKEREVKELMAAYSFALRDQRLVDRIDELSEEFDRIKGLLGRRSVLPNVLTFIGIGICAFSAFLELLCLVASGMFSIGPIFMLIYGLAMIFVGNVIIRSARKRRKEKLEEEFKIVFAKLNEAGDARDALYDDPKVAAQLDAYVKYFPDYDADDKKVMYIIQLIKSGRCDSFKEAINMYDEHMHKAAMLDEQRKTTEATQVAAVAARRVAINTFFD